MKRGDVVHVDLPKPIGAEGHEQVGKRYAIVVQATHLNARLSTVQIVPTTGNPSAIQFPGMVALTASRENGLPSNCIALVHHCRAADKRRITATIGRLSTYELAQIESSLRNIFGLST